MSNAPKRLQMLNQANHKENVDVLHKNNSQINHQNQRKAQAKNPQLVANNVKPSNNNKNKKLAQGKTTNKTVRALARQS